MEEKDNGLRQKRDAAVGRYVGLIIIVAVAASIVLAIVLASSPAN